MKAVIQRVKNASVTVDNKEVASIKNGLFVLLGVSEEDTKEDAEILAKKTVGLRIFSDKDDKMNLSLVDIFGEIIVVSQFTLLADTKKGNRPSFASAMKPPRAKELYEYFVETVKSYNLKSVGTGEFGADMQCSILNDGPVTIVLDSKTWRKQNV